MAIGPLLASQGVAGGGEKMEPISTGIGPMFTVTGTWQTIELNGSQLATGGGSGGGDGS